MNLNRFGNHKPKAYNEYRKNRERSTNTTLKEFIKPQSRNKEKKRTEKNYRNKEKTNKMAIHTYLSIIYLNVSELNVPNKTRRVAEQI